MKHLVALPLKYMRRQKLRTALTAICIVLAVFVLNLFAVAGSSLHKTLMKTEEAEGGTWEFDASYLLAAEDEKQQADNENLLKHHPAVSDYYFGDSAKIYMQGCRDEQDGIGFLEMQINDDEIFRQQYLHLCASEGNPALLPKYDRVENSVSPKKGEVLLPKGELSLRYAVGDTITLRITPMYAVMDDTVPQIKEIRERIAQYNADEDRYYLLLDDGTDKGKVDTTELNRRVEICNIAEVMQRYAYTLNDLELQQYQRGETVEITLTVAGFHDLLFDFPIAQSEDAPYMDTDGVCNSIILSRENMAFAAALENAAQLLFDEQNAAILSAVEEPIRYGCITKNVSFTDGLQMVVDSFNLRKAEGAFDYIIEENALNTALLEVQLRYISYKSNIITMFAFVALALLIIWGFARFVIDNAFEISVLERTKQFATLRIMGASKKQLLALVFTEATAYTIMALIVGIAAAIGTTMLGVQVLAHGYMEHAAFSVYGWLLALTIVLSVLAIYISAYSSAMYASRNLSLKQATRLNKPKQAQKAHKIPKTQRGFLFRYAWKNIKRTRRSLVVSTIAMTLGMTFSVAMALMLVIFSIDSVDMFHDTEDALHTDFTLQCENAAAYTQMLDHCEGNSNYRSYTRENVTNVLKMDPEKTPALHTDGQDLLCIRAIDEKRYNRDLYPITGLTYGDWLASEQALLTYGFPDFPPPIPANELQNKLYQSATYAPASSVFGDAESLIFGDPTVTLGIRLRKPLGIAGCLTAPENTTKPDAEPPEYSLLMPVELYYRLAPGGEIYVDVVAKPSADYDTMIAELEALSDETIGLVYSDSYFENTGYIAQTLRIFAVLAIVIICVWLAGVLTMVNSMHTNVLNRHAELRMLRTVGCSIKQIKKILVTEGMLFSATASILGCGLGLLYAFKLGGIDDILPPAMIGVVTLCIVAAVFGINLVISLLCAKPGMKRLLERETDI